MTKRGKLLRGTEPGLGLVSIDGQDVQFGLRDVWRGAEPPTPGKPVEVEFGQDASVISITAIPDSQIAKEQAAAMAIAARDKGKAVAAAAVAKFGLPNLITTGLLMIGWFFLNAVNIQTFLGNIHLTFWQLLGFLNSGSAFEAMMQGRSGASAGFYGFLAIVALAGPYIAYFWKDRRATLGGMLPLVFMLFVVVMVRSSLHSIMGGTAEGPLGEIQRQAQQEMMNAISLGGGTYVSAIVGLYLAAVSAKQFLVTRATQTEPAPISKQAAA
jgi:hypothetical protein